MHTRFHINLQSFDLFNCFHLQTFSLEAYRRRVQNHPIMPNANPAYETWISLAQQQQCNRNTDTSLQTKENSAYAQRKELALGRSNYINQVYEQI